MEKRSNKSVLDETRDTKGLVNEMEQQKFQFMGHIMRHRFIENDLLTGMVFGKRSRGWQKARMTTTMKEKLGLTMTEGIRTAQYREKRKNTAYAATAVQETLCSEHTEEVQKNINHYCLCI